MKTRDSNCMLRRRSLHSRGSAPWRLLAIGAAAAASACGAADQGYEEPSIAEVSVTSDESALEATDPAGLSRLPGGQRWLNHLTDEIMPYWTSPGALGSPVGNFPTFRCNDGTPYDAQTNACVELRDSADWIRTEIGREYTRMKSRQTFLYGIAYHMTGDAKLFSYHQAGVRWLLDHAVIDGGRGGAITYFVGDQPDPDPRARTAQDLSYAVLGLAMNYYLTRDPAILEVIENLHRYIYDKYYDAALGMLHWTLADQEKELVSQLDQLNAYLVLLTPLLPDRLQRSWKSDIERTVQILFDHFYSKEHRFYWGAVTRPEQLVVGSFHTDFGHTTKAYWMTHLAGRLLGREDWEQFGARETDPTFRHAYITEDSVFGDAGTFQFTRPAYIGAWGEKLTGQETAAPYKSIWPGTEWWSYAELDQAAATYLLWGRRHRPAAGDRLAGYLDTAYPRWFERMVDKEHGGIFHKRTNEDIIEFAKAHLWKNGFHESEHALIGYITSQELRHAPVALHFAFHRQGVNRSVRPYYYDGRLIGAEWLPRTGMGDYQPVRAYFTAIR